MSEYLEILNTVIYFFTFIVLCCTLRTNALTRKTMNMERFENTFFRLFETLQKLLMEITTQQQMHRCRWPTGKYISEVKLACNEGEYSPRLRLFFSLLLQILKYIDKNKIKDKIAYIDIIRPLLSQEILDLPAKYIKNDDSSEYQRLVEKYSIHS